MSSDSMFIFISVGTTVFCNRDRGRDGTTSRVTGSVILTGSRWVTGQCVGPCLSLTCAFIAALFLSVP